MDSKSRVAVAVAAAGDDPNVVESSSLESCSFDCDSDSALIPRQITDPTRQWVTGESTAIVEDTEHGRFGDLQRHHSHKEHPPSDHLVECMAVVAADVLYSSLVATDTDRSFQIPSCRRYHHVRLSSHCLPDGM